MWKFKWRSWRKRPSINVESSIAVAWIEIETRAIFEECNACVVIEHVVVGTSFAPSLRSSFPSIPARSRRLEPVGRHDKRRSTTPAGSQTPVATSCSNGVVASAWCPRAWSWSVSWTRLVWIFPPFVFGDSFHLSNPTHPIHQGP